MKLLSRVTVGILLALTALVLVTNVYSLFTTPVANTWRWWIGDETWLMAEYNQFVHTGHYVNPLAPGSSFSQCSGLLFGSCYLTATLYGLPLLLVKGHTIDAGRTVTFVFSVLTLLALWLIARRYRVRPVLCAYGCLLLAASVCFFIMSHSARSDILIGLTILLVCGCLPLIVETPSVTRIALLGLLLPMSLLINGHVLIVSFPVLVYLIGVAGGFKSTKAFLSWVGAAFAGSVILLLVQMALLGSPSLFGPFSGSSVMMPVLHVIHPKTDLADVQGRFVIASNWAPGVLWVSGVLAVTVIVARFRFKTPWSPMRPAERRMVVCAAILVLSSIFLEFYWERYLIYVLPTVVLAILLLLSYFARILPRVSITMVSAALGLCLVFALWQYREETTRMCTVGEAITSANTIAVRDALAAIHLRQTGKPRVFCTVPGQYIAIDDSCDLVTPVMYAQPISATMSRTDLWNHANINYAIVCRAAHSDIDWDDIDAQIDPSARSRSKVIFERVGPFSDIGRPYEIADLKLLDTLRVYEFQ